MNNKIKIFAVLITCLYFWYYVFTYTEWHFIDSVNLAFHEAGHAIFFFLGKFLNILAGSAFQIILPTALSLYFFYKGEKISGSLCLLWVAQNFLNTSIYVGDAMKMELDLIGGEYVTHDWNYILNTLGIIKYTNTISTIFYNLGMMIMTAGTVLSIFFSTKDN